ncbi:DNA methyltransferase [Aeromonas phage vB_AveS_KLEA5]|nr:DNA methyltransferase [Aeromonas phage vB_AveS_KLEA5]
MHKLMLGNCLEQMKNIPDHSVDMVLADPPYGTTTCKWDSIIPLEPMWVQLKRIIKPNGAIVMTAAQPFTTILIHSNIEMHKYNLVWRKSKVCHFAQAPYRFLTEHEDIVVFSFGGTSKNAKNRMKYNPQGLYDCHVICRGKGHSEHRPSNTTQPDYVQSKTGYPKSILEFSSDTAKIHSTQKPVALMEYLIKTYTDEGQLVLDFTMGSGTTGIAAANTGRDFIGIELDEKIYSDALFRHLDCKIKVETLL